MIRHTPIDEYVFWKKLIQDKQEMNEEIPRIIHELLDNAEAEMLFYLIEKKQNDKVLTNPRTSKKFMH